MLHWTVDAIIELPVDQAELDVLANIRSFGSACILAKEAWLQSR
jgi:hypothetical protein